MASDMRNAKIAGASYLVSYLGLILGSMLLEPILGSTDYLTSAYPNALVIGIGVLLESLNGIAVISIAVMLYTILKRYDMGLALGYLFFRAVEGLLSILGSTKALTLIDLSKQYIDQGSPASPIFDVLGAITLADRHWDMEMLTVFFILGALIFYFLLYRTEVVPKYISIWGMIAIFAIMVLNVFIYFSIDIGFVAVVFALPIIANEIFIAFWLIVKGVDSSNLPANS